MTRPAFLRPASLHVVPLALALAACQQPADDGDIAIDNGTTTPADVQSRRSSPGPIREVASAANSAAPSAAAAATLTKIPSHYHGRWGMVAADCTSTRGDAKGLITIGDNTIRFYESTATLVEQRPAAATGFAATYHFTGEGQEWDKVETLKRSGDTLTRADDEGNFNYRRC